MDKINLISDMNGERIDRFLSGNLEDLSRSYIQKLMKDGRILVNGKPVKANYKLSAGDEICVSVLNRKHWIYSPKISLWTFSMRTMIS